MATSGKTQTAKATPFPLTPKIAGLLKEAGGLTVLVLLVFLTLSLATYHPQDPGWSTSGSNEQIKNACGAFGAWLADILLYIFGLSAWWLVFSAGLAVRRGYLRVIKKRVLDPHPTWIAATGLVLLLLASSSLETLRFYQISADLPQEPGGVIGAILGSFSFHAAGFTGGTLLLLLILAIGFSLHTGVSWLTLMERVGAMLEEGWDRLARLPSALAAKREALEDRRAGKLAQVVRKEQVAVEKKRAEEHKPLHIEPPVASIPKSERVERERQAPLFQSLPDSPLPPLHLLDEAEQAGEIISAETLEYTSRLIERKLQDFGVSVQVVAAYPGPVITRYEIEPDVGVKGSQIVNLARDLARALSVVSVRVVETIPGKSCMGLEIPNPKRQVVRLSEILGAQIYADMRSPLTMAMGKDIAGKPVVADLAKMPHALVAGTTGSGKSVAINAMILSLLYKADPRDVRLILIDPKMLELSIYEGIPHLLAPVVTDMKQASHALNWCVGEMERRYRLMSNLGVRNIAGCNQKIQEAQKAGEPLTNPFSLTPETPEPLEEMPYIVVVIDELADLMMVVGKKVEELIARLAQKARAAGIHLVLATQRPSVDVITGLIKANIPTRVAFQVSSKIDSRTILDQMGAEALLGQGDMLYLPPGSGFPLRVHGAFVADNEVHSVVEYLKSLGEPNYIEAVLAGGSEEGGSGFEGGSEEGGEKDELYDEAVAVVLKTRRASISAVQRHLRIGYNRAARLIEDMERAGLVSPMQSNGNRDVLIKNPDPE